MGWLGPTQLTTIDFRVTLVVGLMMTITRRRMMMKKMMKVMVMMMAITKRRRMATNGTLFDLLSRWRGYQGYVTILS